ncbi:MerR family transcriptional regulator [Promicromonospora sp. NPDC057488]|uniref:helix-turn-helix domain-containing protein n=1 Tax=Promicromonospora sp. NPDC057488 TaxID=3346147 RepID=UPI00367171DC
MTWSTREVAELSGTTVKTVRYYHQVGLLDEPDREPNGYNKRYEVRHLTRLLQIKRLTGLGLSLAQVAELGTAAHDGRPSLFQEIDAELEATVERIQGIRQELAALSRPGATPDVPATFHDVARPLRDNDRALLTIYAQLFSAESMDTLRGVLAANPHEAVDEAFRDLPADADEATRQALAERMAPFVGANGSVTLEPKATTTRQAEAARNAVGQALQALYSSAQLDVLRRAHELSEAEAKPEAKTKAKPKGP